MTAPSAPADNLTVKLVTRRSAMIGLDITLPGETDERFVPSNVVEVFAGALRVNSDAKVMAALAALIPDDQA